MVITPFSEGPSPRPCVNMVRGLSIGVSVPSISQDFDSYCLVRSFIARVPPAVVIRCDPLNGRHTVVAHPLYLRFATAPEKRGCMHPIGRSSVLHAVGAEEAEALVVTHDYPAMTRAIIALTRLSSLSRSGGKRFTASWFFAVSIRSASDTQRRRIVPSARPAAIRHAGSFAIG